MEIRIDNYYVSKNGGNYIKVCIDGQNIIHERTSCKTRRETIDYGVGAIEKYNERHGLKWGEVG